MIFNLITLTEMERLTLNKKQVLVLEIQQLALLEYMTRMIKQFHTATDGLKVLAKVDNFNKLNILLKTLILKTMTSVHLLMLLQMLYLMFLYTSIIKEQQTLLLK